MYLVSLTVKHGIKYAHTDGAPVTQDRSTLVEGKGLRLNRFIFQQLPF